MLRTRLSLRLCFLEAALRKDSDTPCRENADLCRDLVTADLSRHVDLRERVCRQRGIRQQAAGLACVVALALQLMKQTAPTIAVATRTRGENAP